MEMKKPGFPFESFASCDGLKVERDWFGRAETAVHSLQYKQIAHYVTLPSGTILTVWECIGCVHEKLRMTGKCTCHQGRSCYIIISNALDGIRGLA